MGDNLDISECIKSDNCELIQSALLALLAAKKNGKDFSGEYPDLKALLIHPDHAIRWLTVELLCSDPSIIRLKEQSPDERIRELGFLAETTIPNMVQDRSERDIEYAMPAIAALILDEESKVALAAIETAEAALSDRQEISLTYPALFKIISGGDDPLRSRAVLIFRKAVMSPYETPDMESVLPIFKKLLEDPCDKVKWGAADLLTAYHVKKKQWILAKSLLRHKDKDIRQEAVGTLMVLYEKTTPLRLDVKKLLSDPAEDVRLVAARTVIQKSAAPTFPELIIPILTRALQHPSDDTRIYAAEAAYRFITLIALKKKSTAQNSKLLKQAEPLISEMETRIADTQIKVATPCTKTLIRYYCLRELSVSALSILRKADPEMLELIIKDLEPPEIRKPEEVLNFITEAQRQKFHKHMEMHAANNTTVLRLSSEDFKAVKWIELPKEIGTIPSLKKLYINQNQLRTLPDEIGNLINLEYLTATGNLLESLPHSIGNLKKLGSLYLYHNRIRALPKEIGELSGLRMLQLSNNRLSVLPEEIGNLSQLSDLDIQQNRLKKLPATIGRLFNLKRLDLRNNRLQEFPKEMEELQNLESLMLDNNDLYEIPQFVFYLSNLKYLGFSFNQITSIPAKLSVLKKLEILELRNNRIASIPAELEALSNLRTLDLAGNILTHLPKEMKNLHQLRFLHLSGNPLNVDQSALRTGEASAVLRSTSARIL